MRALDWALVVLLGAAFAPAVIALSAVWSGVDYYSHGYLVPFVALWAASAQREVLPGLPSERQPLGLAVIAVALVLQVIGLAAGSVGLAGLGVPVAVAGAVLYLRGWAWLRALSFAIAYLGFMLPLPSALLTPVIVGLQGFVSGLGVWIVRALGQAVAREGNVILLPGGESLFVAEACSGITSLVTLVPLGVFLAWFSERSWLRRGVLVATVVPVAMLCNLARVVATILAAERIGAAAATESALHDWVGIFTYVLACLVLLGVARWMAYLAPPGDAGAVRIA